MRQSYLGQSSGKAEAVQQAEAKCDEPWPSRRKGWSSAPVIDDLDGNQHDAQRNRGLNRRPGYGYETECCGRKREAVRQSKCGYRNQYAAPVADQDHEREYKQQVIEAEENVFD